MLAVPMPKTAIAIAPAIKNKEKTLLFVQESFSYKKTVCVNTNYKIFNAKGIYENEGFTRDQ